MLTILKVKESNRITLFERIFGAKAEAYIRNAGDITYLELICDKNKKGIPWKKVVRLSLDCNGKILMPKGVEPPEHIGLERFFPSCYPSDLLFELLIEVMKKIKSKKHISLAICTSDFERAEKVLKQTVSLAADIRVISAFPEQMNLLLRKILHETGAAVIVTDNAMACNGCNIIFAPEGLPSKVRGNEKSLIFAPCGKAKGLIVRWAEAQMPIELAAVYDEAYDKTEFLAAFYELGESNGSNFLRPIIGKNIKESYSLEQLSQYITKNINIPTAE